MQRLGPTSPAGPGDERSFLQAGESGEAAPGTPPVKSAAVLGALEHLREQTDERLSALDRSIAEIAKSVQQAMWEGPVSGQVGSRTRGDDAALFERLRDLESHLTRLESQLTKATQALEATDSRSRDVLAAMAKELVTVSDQQHELRRELHRLVARIVGRPLL